MKNIQIKSSNFMALLTLEITVNFLNEAEDEYMFWIVKHS